jgi:hypothetical protein
MQPIEKRLLAERRAFHLQPWLISSRGSELIR